MKLLTINHDYHTIMRTEDRSSQSEALWNQANSLTDQGKWLGPLPDANERPAGRPKLIVPPLAGNTGGYLASDGSGGLHANASAKPMQLSRLERKPSG